MTKARTKAERRRAKRRITLAGGESVAQPAGQGRRVDLEPKEPADAIALAARARLTGCTVEAARDVLAADDVGRCIMAMRPGAEDRRALLSVWQGISAAWSNYCARVLSLTPTPQAASLPMLPEPMQTDQSLRVDLRTHDERDEAARRVWAEWRASFNALPPDQAVTIAATAQGISAPVWDADNLRPTRYGAIAVKALVALHEMRAR
jgi:hypothetical protein